MEGEIRSKFYQFARLAEEEGGTNKHPILDALETSLHIEGGIITVEELVLLKQAYHITTTASQNIKEAFEALEKTMNNTPITA